MVSSPETVWVTDVPISFSGPVHVVEYHVAGGERLTCSLDTEGTLVVDEKGKVILTTRSGTFSISEDGTCIEQGKDAGWQVEGLVELSFRPYLKFITCGDGALPAEGSAEYIVAEYQQDIQISKLTGGATCYDQNNQAVASFSFYLISEEPRN